MKMLKVFLLLLAIFLTLPTQSFCSAIDGGFEHSFTNKKNAVVTCRLSNPEEDHASTYALWFEAFSKTYSAFSLEDLQVTAFDSKESWLSGTFDVELQDFREQKQPLWMFQARIKERVVGAAILEPEKNVSSTLYVRQLAVHPNDQNQGIGRGMMEGIEKIFPSFDQIVLLVRSVNEPAIRFYEHLGYEQSGYMHPDYKNKPYIGFRKRMDHKSP
jgi:ribosomal protein S18 acetylase RimI-like enzyme